MDDRENYDPARLLTYSGLLFILILLCFVCCIIGWQILQSGEANTESWAALTGLLGWITGQVGNIYSARYGTSRQSETKDATIARQSETAAAIAGSVAGTGSGLAPIRAAEVNIDSQNTTLTTGDITK